ncbi:MAG TPA: BatA domain-containing protein, partial [Gemmatimonadales bacterium]|nr:BatA domain-containing protein [Gemmatimonadales bacterium]
MWSLGAPAFLAAAVVAAAVVTALHLLAWRRPTPSLLPTARFIPAAAVRAVSRDLRLTDALLLALRVLALLLLGVALAAPRLAPAPRGEARVVVADRARGVADVGEVRDSVAALAAGAVETRVIWFDSIPAAAVNPGSAEAAPGERREVRGALSAALVAAVREGERILRRRERVEVVVVSPMVGEEVDPAVAAVRELWPGALRVVRVAARATPPTPPLPVPATRIPPTDDALGAAYRLAVGDSPRPALRVERADDPGIDTAFAGDGGVVVRWPAGTGSDAPVAVPRAVSAGGHTFVSALAAAPLPDEGRVIAWWEDGTPAAREEARGAGCVRSIGWHVPEEGDVVLRPGFL